MIYVTGDLHGRYDSWKLEDFAEIMQGKSSKKDDYLIIAGDFGLIWADEGDERDKADKEIRDWLDEQQWTTLFVDGNHENGARLASYPVEEWHGGDIHKVGASIYHLMRGQVFDIDGSSIFTMGGAYSHDKQHRVKGVSWWEEEVPNPIERNTAIANLDKCDWKVDYVITHDAPIDIAKVLIHGKRDRQVDEYEDWLQKKIADNLTFKRWYFGHHHMYMSLGDRDEYQCIYNSIIKIGA